jgi:hypothetical protein
LLGCCLLVVGLKAVSGEDRFAGCWCALLGLCLAWCLLSTTHSVRENRLVVIHNRVV